MDQANHNEQKGTNEFRARLDQSRGDCAEMMGQLLEAYRPYLLHVAKEEIDSALRGKAGGSDLVQQTFLEANKDFAGFRGTTEAELLAWLRKILLNNIANFHRQFRANGKRDVDREVPMDAVDSSVITVGIVRANELSPSEQFLAREEADAIELALTRLPDDYRKAIEMRHRQQRSFAEIGEALGRSPDAARKLWARAIEALQGELAPSS